MTFFEEYLALHRETPTALPTGTRQDEAALFFLLLQEKLFRGSAALGYHFDMPPSLDELSAFANNNGISVQDLEIAVRFVSGILCYFIPKLMSFRRDVTTLRSFLIPNFWEDEEKQRQLLASLKDGFYFSTIEDLQSAHSLDAFIEALGVREADGLLTH